MTFCVIFSLAFLFSFCFGIFGAFDKCSDGAGRQERERGIERGRGPKKHCHWTFKSIWIRRRIRARVRSTFAVLVCLFSFPAQTVRYVVVAAILSVIVVVVCVCFVKFHCYPKMAALFVLTFFRISLSLSLFLGLSFCSDSKRDSCECFRCCCSYCHLYWWGVFYFMLLGVCVTPVHIRPKLPSSVGLACLWLLSDCWQFS